MPPLDAPSNVPSPSPIIMPPLLQAIETKVFFQGAMKNYWHHCYYGYFSRSTRTGRAPSSSISHWMTRLSQASSLVTAENKNFSQRSQEISSKRQSCLLAIFKKKQNIINYNYYSNNDNCN